MDRPTGSHFNNQRLPHQHWATRHLAIWRDGITGALAKGCGMTLSLTTLARFAHIPTATTPTSKGSRSVIILGRSSGGRFSQLTNWHQWPHRWGPLQCGLPKVRQMPDPPIYGKTMGLSFSNGNQSIHLRCGSSGVEARQRSAESS